ncbi:hypothetical protein GTP58_24515 [Duganella sp. CY15W]|uniref:helix-turn-helix domain-containing protein n=1 Tax=Duganella sp. CY15W TaxID=2692172 RepID=UPI00136BE09B|nr:helix-turn-helix domain-containing protein [Duganella sp. CY15W]MYM31502.1 hypothetical protein [Duganella sp. CY15W]
MSIALMTLAWKMDLPTHPKMVLLALCDNANDQGECYPSVAMLTEKCSMSERSVQKHIADMEKTGVITRAYRAGRSTVYQINPRKLCTPAADAPPQNAHPTPATGAPTPPQLVHPTPATGAPITIIEPSIEPSSKHHKRRQAGADAFDAKSALLAEGVSVQAADDWLMVRKAHRAPLTSTALAQMKREADKAGMSMDSVVTLCCSRNWRGFQADWVVDGNRMAGGQAKQSGKFAVGRLDHSSSRAAMDESMRQRGIRAGNDDDQPL